MNPSNRAKGQNNLQSEPVKWVVQDGAGVVVACGATMQDAVDNAAAIWEDSFVVHMIGPPGALIL